MNITFRQGIIAFQKTPRFVNTTIDGNVNLNAHISSTLVTFAHGKQNYLLIEQQSIINAWDNTPPTGEYWIFWDIDKDTSQRSFGGTSIEPKYGTSYPISPEIDLHFFNTTINKMMVWDGGKWISKIRVFAGKICNGVLNPEGIYSQVNIYGKYNTDIIIRDGYSEPINRFDSDGNFEFVFDNNVNTLTTFSNISNVKYAGTSTCFGIASETIPKHHCITWGANNTLKLATPLDSSNSCIGIAENNADIGAVCRIITHGFVLDRSGWSWSNPINTPIFVGGGGVLSTVLSENVSTQKIGHVVNSRLIFVNVREQILIDQII